MSRWRCRRYRAWLVDAADGTLDASRQPRLNTHLTACAACAADLASLRAVPALLQATAVPDPGEEFFRQQRQDIHRAIRGAQPAAATWQPWPRRPIDLTTWRLPLAVAASALLALCVLHLTVPRRHPRAYPPAAAVATLDTGVLTELQDVMHVIIPRDDVLTLAAQADDPALATAPRGAPLGLRAEPSLWDAHDLDDEALDHVGDLLGMVT
jgi:anti-sigma factor RsiW